MSFRFVYSSFRALNIGERKGHALVYLVNSLFRFVSSDWALGLAGLALAMLSLRSRYALALLLPSYRDTELSSPTEPALVLYDSALSTVTHVIGPSFVSLYAVVTVGTIPREEYGIPEPLLSL